MYNFHVPQVFVLLYAISFIINCSSSSYGDSIESKLLNVGVELWKESIPLQSGSRLYQLKELKSYTWYEVKISYPASIPASFTLQLKKGDLDQGLNINRRLLNTEKLIFKTDSLDIIDEQGGLYVLVTVEPEGFVAIPHVQERQFIIFNIVCDELYLGIPHKAWLVVVLVLLCLIVAVIVPQYIPSDLLRRNQSRNNQNADKNM